jgi:hypothetical protein
MNKFKKYLLVAAGLLAMLSAGSAHAQIAPFSTVMRISVAPRSVVTKMTDAINTIATLGQARDGSIALIVRSFDRPTGFQQGSPFIVVFQEPDTGFFKDVLVSTVFEPGSVLVLDSERRVHINPLGFRSDGTPFLAAPSRVIGPLGPISAGEGTVIGETLVANHAAGTVSILAIGTANGDVVLAANNGGEVVDPICSPISSGPIQDLGPITQAGYFALGAVSGGKLFLINPDNDAAMAGLQPRLVADLRDPRRIPLIDFGSPILTRDSLPFIDPLSGFIVTANGTVEIATLEIPANPTFGDTMNLRLSNPNEVPVKQVVFGSLTWLPTDGAGVLYNAGFNFDDGIVGRTWTIAGASLEIDPNELKLKQHGGFVKALIECENQRAAEINPATVSISIEGVAGSVPFSIHPPPKLKDADGDNNLDLILKVNDAALNLLLSQTSADSAVVRATWQFNDGTPGEASAVVRIIK